MPTSRLQLLAFTLLAPLAAPTLAQDKITYVDHVLPIFRNSCNNCHNPDKKKAGLDLTTYGATMAGSENGPILKPGQADGSLLFKVCAQTEEPKMPPKGDKLTDAELALMKNWIAGFALETATSKPAAVQNQVTLAAVSLTKPDGPPPMPGDLPLEPFVRPKANTAITATRKAFPVGGRPRNPPVLVPRRSNSEMTVSSSATCIRTCSWRWSGKAVRCARW